MPLSTVIDEPLMNQHHPLAAAGLSEFNFKCCAAHGTLGSSCLGWCRSSTSQGVCGTACFTWALQPYAAVCSIRFPHNLGSVECCKHCSRAQRGAYWRQA